MPRACVCTNSSCDKDVSRFAFALASYWEGDALRKAIKELRPNESDSAREEVYEKAIKTATNVRVSSRHFYWHDLDWSGGGTPHLVFKGDTPPRPRYLLHSDRPTVAGEKIVDPSRKETVDLQESRIRPGPRTGRPLEDLTNLNSDDVSAGSARVPMGLKRRRSAPAVGWPRGELENAFGIPFERVRDDDEWYRELERKIQKLRYENSELKTKLRVESQRASDARDEVNTLNAVIKQIRNTTGGASAARKHITMQGLRTSGIDDDHMRALTGWPTLKIFESLWRFVNAGELDATQSLRIPSKTSKGDSTSACFQSRAVAPRKKSFRWEDVFLAWWMRAKMDLTIDQLTFLVGVRKATLTRALQQMTSYLTVFLHAYAGETINPEWIEATTSGEWKKAYGQIPYEIIDATEVPVETPDDPYMQRLFYSHYKHRYVCKFLGACHPNGLAAFCSLGFPGSIFDNEICFAGEDHPMLNHAAHRASIPRRMTTLSNGESIVVPETIAADRGFCEGLNRQFERDAFRLVHPAFSRGQNVSFSKEDILNTRQQASRRVIIENAFGRVKSTWKRMRGPVAISKLKSVHLEWRIIFFLALDLQAPLR